MTISEQTAGLLLVIALVAVLLLVVAVAILALRLRKLHQSYGNALDPADRDDAFQALHRLTGEVDQLRDDVQIVHGNTEKLRGLVAATLSRVGIVRYDAFADMGGALSFSAALLDEAGDGVVVSAINGRSETRTYAKPVRARQSEYNLSPEEVEAVEAAMAGQKGSTDPLPKSSRRRRAAS